MQPTDVRKKASLEQFEMLINEIEKNPSLLQGRMSSVTERSCHREQWKALTRRLNSVENGTFKPASKWQQAWRDWKSNTKKKAAKILEERSQGFDSKTPLLQQLTDLELRVVNLLEPDLAETRTKEIDISSIAEIDPLPSDGENSPGDSEHEEPFTYAPDMVTVYSIDGPSSSNGSGIKSERLSPARKKSKLSSNHHSSSKVKPKRHRIEFLSTASDSIRQETADLVGRLTALEAGRQASERRHTTLLEAAVAALERNATAASRQADALERLTHLLDSRLPADAGDRKDPMPWKRQHSP